MKRLRVAWMRNARSCADGAEPHPARAERRPARRRTPTARRRSSRTWRAARAGSSRRTTLRRYGSYATNACSAAASSPPLSFSSRSSSESMFMVMGRTGGYVRAAAHGSTVPSTQLQLEFAALNTSGPPCAAFAVRAEAVARRPRAPAATASRDAPRRRAPSRSAPLARVRRSRRGGPASRCSTPATSIGSDVARARRRPPAATRPRPAPAASAPQRCADAPRPPATMASRQQAAFGRRSSDACRGFGLGVVATSRRSDPAVAGLLRARRRLRALRDSAGSRHRASATATRVAATARSRDVVGVGDGIVGLVGAGELGSGSVASSARFARLV